MIRIAGFDRISTVGDKNDSFFTDGLANCISVLAYTHTGAEIRAVIAHYNTAHCFISGSEVSISKLQGFKEWMKYQLIGNEKSQVSYCIVIGRVWYNAADYMPTDQMRHELLMALKSVFNYEPQQAVARVAFTFDGKLAPLINMEIAEIEGWGTQGSEDIPYDQFK